MRSAIGWAGAVIMGVSLLAGCLGDDDDGAPSDGGAAGGGGGSGAGAGGSSGAGGEPGGTCPPNVQIPALCRICDDGSCGVPVCDDGGFTGEWRCPEDPSPVDCDCGRESYVPVCGIDSETYDATCGRECVPVRIACDGECPCTGCVRGGCSGQLCADAGDEPPASTCEWREEYACYQGAACERQSNGECGFTETEELAQCLEDAGVAELHWYMTCGDPVCGPEDETADDPNVPNCTSEELGDSCSEEGALCDGIASCGVRLICAATDPTMGPGGCPISRGRFKNGVAYLGEQELQGYHAELMSIPLASYHYEHAPGAGPQLGFLIDDIEPSVAVSGDHVNMYGYLSMAVAAIQVQQKQIATLQRALDAMREELAAQARQETASCGP